MCVLINALLHLMIRILVAYVNMAIVYISEGGRDCASEAHQLLIQSYYRRQRHSLMSLLTYRDTKISSKISLALDGYSSPADYLI